MVFFVVLPQRIIFGLRWRKFLWKTNFNLGIGNLSFKTLTGIRKLIFSNFITCRVMQRDDTWWLIHRWKFWVGPNTRIRFEIWFAGGSFLLTAGRKFGGLLAGFNFAWCGSTMKHEIRKNLNSQSVNAFFEIHWLACDSRPNLIILLNTNTNRFAFLLDNFLITISNFENFCLRWLKRHLVVKFTKS